MADGKTSFKINQIMNQLNITKSNDLDDCFLLDSILHPRNKTNLLNYYNLFPVVPQSGISKQDEINVVEETTTFEDSKESMTVMPAAPRVPRSFKPFNENSEKTIRSFLARPKIVADGQFLSSTPVGLFQREFLHTALQDPIYKKKLEGTYALRYTTVLTLKLNATRFQTGSVMLCWTPSGGTIGSIETLRYSINFTSLTQFTQTMNVKASFAYDSSISLRIPFAADRYCHTNTPSPDGNPGSWAIVVYAPLRFVTGTNNVPFTLYQSFEDVEMYGAVIPQSGIKKQGGTKKDVFSAEMFSDRPISSTLKLGASVTNALASIPILSSISTPVSWMLDAASRAAYIWGYSNPKIISKASRYINSWLPYGCASDGGDIAQSLGLNIASSVNIAEGFGGSDFDQMSFDYIKQIDSYFDTFTFSAADGESTILKEIRIGPSNYFVDGITSATVNCTPVKYLSLISKRWSGGLVFTFELFKSPFHAGRLAFIYQPSTKYTISTPTLIDMEYTSKNIVDITDHNIIEVTIPYISVDTWTLSENSIGTLYVMVIDGLISPADVSGVMDINVMVRGAPDFQVAQPSNVKISPAVPQSGIELTAENLKFELGTTSLTKLDYTKNADCIGETFESFKCIVGTYRIIPSFPSAVITSTTNVQPFAFGYKNINAYVWNIRDTISAVALCYGVYRGGMNISASLLDSYTGYIVPSLVDHIDSNSMLFATATTEITQALSLNNAQSLTFAKDQAAVVNVPYYCDTPATSVTSCLYNLSASPGTNVADTKATLNLSFFGTEGSARVLLHRSAADDFQLGMFMSIPTIIAP
jgi:hypothetical protein